MKYVITVLIFGIGVFCLSLEGANALEEKISDLSASVEVASVFGLSLDNRNLNFGLIKPGSTKILGEGRFFNEVRCRSNTGRTWYLKTNLVSLGLLGRGRHLPPSCLKWKIAEFLGSAEPLGKFAFQEFSEQPVLIYTSQDKDNKGKEVALRFQYSFTSPVDTMAGDYTGQIIFTMTESP